MTLLLWAIRLEGLTCSFKKSRGHSWPTGHLFIYSSLLGMSGPPHVTLLTCLSLHQCCLTRPHLAFAFPSSLSLLVSSFLVCSSSHSLGFVVLLMLYDWITSSHMLASFSHRVFNTVCHCHWVFCPSIQTLLVHHVLGSYALKKRHHGTLAPVSHYHSYHIGAGDLLLI